MKKLFTAFLLCAAALIASSFLIKDSDNDDRCGEYMVELNAIEQMMLSGDTSDAAARTEQLRQSMASEKESGDKRIPVMCGICLLFTAAVSGYCAIAVIRPFEKLIRFADEIASGNFDIPLNYERSNYFGKFTWAFDRMRREITNARSCEQEAVENNKTVIASLSHDIKTPVASVRAYAEALEMGMDQSPELRSEYLETMMRKCDEITRLTDDMLLHALSDLGRLHMKPEIFELTAFVGETIRDLCGLDIKYDKPLYTVDVSADPGRTAQVLENLIHNARKYAGSEIMITITRTAEFAHIHVRDYGPGIPDDDMPFICDRFYRGRNAGKESGSGLGLYIVKYIAEQSGGSLELKNHNDGLEVTFSLPIV